MTTSSIQAYCENKIVYIVRDYRKHPSAILAVWAPIQEVALEIFGRGVGGIELIGRSIVHLNDKELAESLFVSGIKTFSSSLIILAFSPLLIIYASIFAYNRGSRHYPLFERPARNLADLADQ